MSLRFFLGGHDLEMVTIRALLDEHAAERVVDKVLSWGARASAYRGDIDRALELGETPVLVELEDDLDLQGRGAVIVVDHHGARAGRNRKTSLHQVFDLLGLPPSAWTRWHELVAANDIGHVRGLLDVGATEEEIAQVRAADRTAQGITLEEEVEGARAIEEAARPIPELMVVRVAHNKTAAVVDRVREHDVNLLVLSPNEMNFFGDGKVVRALHARFGGWYGGGLPERGFWGQSGELAEIESVVINELTKRTMAATARARRG